LSMQPGTIQLDSSVGHAGALGSLAALALCGVAPPAMRPAALKPELMWRDAEGEGL
jgi:hypothetical protein